MRLPTARDRYRSASGLRPALALSGAATLVFVLLAGAAVLLARGDATREADANALNVARAVGQDIARNLQLYDLTLRTVARQIQAPGVMALDPELRQALLFDGPGRDGQFGFINVLNEQGEVIADSGSAVPRPGHFAGRDYFRAQRANTQDTLAIGRPFLTDPGQPTMIAVSRRMQHADGSFAGVVVGSVRVAYFAEVFTRFSVGTHGTITLLRDDGMILQRHPAAPNEIGHVVQPVPFNGLDQPRPDDAPDPVDHAVRRFVLYHLDGLPLAVAIGLAPQDTYAAWRVRAAAILGAVLLLGLGNGGLLLWLRRTTVQQEIATTKLRDHALELQRLAKLHREAVEAGNAAHRRRSEQLAEISHDMRALLHGVLGNADAISRQGELNAEQSRSLAGLRSAGKHLHAIAKRFLRDARVRDAGPHLLPAPTDIRALLDQSRRMVGRVAEEKGLQLHVAADPALPSLVVVDGVRLSVVLGNLLDNAVRYTERGSVAVHAALDGEKLRFVIADTGPGLPQAQKQQLRGTASGPATAAGLAIVLRHTRMLGGAVDCLPDPRGGTIISLEVPATPALAEDPVESSAPFRPLHVLVVDDSEISRMPTAGLLRAAGHQVDEAASGEAAIPKVRGKNYDAVVMDLQMNGMSGIDATHEIRGLAGRRGRTPIIALSADVAEDNRASWREAGVNEYLAKPCEQGHLLAALRRAAGDAAPPSSGASVGVTGACVSAWDRQKDGTASSYQQVLLQELEGLLALLEADGDPSESLARMAHRVGGDAAQLGFATLADICRRYEHALNAGSAVGIHHAALTVAVRGSIAELHHRLHGSWNGEGRSASPA